MRSGHAAARPSFRPREFERSNRGAKPKCSSSAKPGDYGIVHDAEAVGVAVGRESHLRALFGDGFSERREVLVRNVRTGTVKKNVALGANGAGGVARSERFLSRCPLRIHARACPARLLVFPG